jgi:AraC-like DNA-binding protein
MAARRRIDWSVLPGVQPDAPIWGDRPAASQLLATLAPYSVLFEFDEADALLRRAVEFALDPVGLVRAGLYLYDEPADLMLGTWGTDLEGRVIDEHHAMFELGANGRRVFERAQSGEAYWTVVENCPIIDQRGQSTKVVGEGWVVCTPVCAGERRLGMLYNDAGLTNASVDPVRQLNAAILCCLVGWALRAMQHSNQFADLPTATTRHPVLRRAVHLLGRNPSLGGEKLAAELGISLSRLARIFKDELGLSLVDYRNQLRLERFTVLVEGGGTNLLKAALEAGFGSYAQFHRVFRAARGRTPREYFAARGVRWSRGPKRKSTERRSRSQGRLSR